MPALFAVASSILGSPLERIASFTPSFFSSSRPGFTSGMQIGVHQLLLLVGRKVELEILAGPDEAVLSEAPEVAMATHKAAHEAVVKLLYPPDL